MHRLPHPIFFMHIPKCAGKSVFSILSRKFDRTQICPQPPYGTWQWTAGEVRGYSLYSGHFSTDFVEEMATGGAKLVIMRHPLSRIVSLYDFWRSYRWDYINSSLPAPPFNGPALAKSGSLMNFLETTSEFGVSRIYNTAARQVLGRRFAQLWPNQDAIISESIAALRGFAWVGISELFGPSAALLCELLQQPVLTPEPLEGATRDVSTDPNREIVSRSKPTALEVERILEGNRVDLALYAEGRKILEERIGQTLADPSTRG